jgi:hypothetical protein
MKSANRPLVLDLTVPDIFIKGPKKASNHQSEAEIDSLDPCLAVTVTIDRLSIEEFVLEV